MPRAQIATVAPSSASDRAMALPIPWLPPVTRAVFPDRPVFMGTTGYRMARAYNRSIRPNACELDHLCPLLGFRGDEPAEVGRRACQHGAPHVGDSSLDLGIGERRVDLSVELGHDRGWRMSGRTNSLPDTRLESREGFGHRRDIRERVRPHRGRYPKHAQLAGFDV